MGKKTHLNQAWSKNEDDINTSVSYYRGHLFMTTTWRGRGQAQEDACRRGEESGPSDVHTENLEINDLRVKVLNFRVNND